MDKARIQNRNVVGPRIREARLSEKPKATMSDISARLQTEGVTLSVTSIWGVEQGMQAVTDIQLLAFAKVLRVNPLWLLGLSNQKK